MTEHWTTRPISDARFDDEDVIDEALANFLNSPEFSEKFHELRGGVAVEPGERPTSAADEAPERNPE